MELADLVRAVTRARLLLRFFVLGGLAFAALRTETRAVTIEVTDPVVLDDELLLEHAVAQGWPAVDAVVRQRLLAALAAVGEERSPEALARALALGLHRRDPVARARLVASARRALARPVALARGEAQVARLRALARASTLGRPAMARFDQVFLARQTRPRLDEDAAEIAARLAAGDPAAGDPWPWRDPQAWISVARIDQAMGPELARTVATTPLGRWTGPIASPFGVHFVRVEAREPARPCAPERLAALVAEETDEEARRLGLARALADLRLKVRVVR